MNSKYNLCSFLFEDSKINLINGEEINFIQLNLKSNEEFRNFLKARSGIYCWINIIDNKIYIGRSKNLFRRFKSHFGTLLTFNNRNNIKLKNAVKKYGIKNFKFAIIEFLPNTHKILTDAEQAWLDKLQPLDLLTYNINKYAEGAYKPAFYSEEARLKIIERHSGENSELAKLTNEKVLFIKRELASNKSLKSLAEKFGVSTTVISNIKRGKTWKFVLAEPEIEMKLRELVKKDVKGKLTPDLVKEIKTYIKNGKSITEISKKMNLVLQTVSSVKNGHIYSYITID